MYICMLGKVKLTMQLSEEIFKMNSINTLFYLLHEVKIEFPWVYRRCSIKMAWLNRWVLHLITTWNKAFHNPFQANKEKFLQTGVCDLPKLLFLILLTLDKHWTCYHHWASFCHHCLFETRKQKQHTYDITLAYH